MRLVIFIQDTPRYCAKTQAGFPDTVAKDLVDRKVARYVGDEYPPKPIETPKPKKKKARKKR